MKEGTVRQSWIEIGSDAYNRPIEDSFNPDTPVFLVNDGVSLPVFRHVLVEKQYIVEDSEE